jgi:membrane associated rhomboid family serine protease
MEGSMETEREGKNATITVIRRSARVLTVISVIFAGLLWLVASAEGTPGNSMGPLAAIWFGLLGIYAVAMFLALKWERAAVRRCRGSPPRSPR